MKCAEVPFTALGPAVADGFALVGHVDPVEFAVTKPLPLVVIEEHVVLPGLTLTVASVMAPVPASVASPDIALNSALVAAP